MAYYKKIITDSNGETLTFSAPTIAECDAWKAEILKSHDIVSESLDDITAEFEKSEKIRKLRVKKQFAQEVIDEINFLIDDLPTESRLALAQRADIQQVLFYLNQGSIVDSKTLVQNLSIDAHLTETIKGLILSALQSKIDLFANI